MSLKSIKFLFQLFSLIKCDNGNRFIDFSSNLIRNMGDVGVNEKQIVNNNLVNSNHFFCTKQTLNERYINNVFVSCSRRDFLFCFCKFHRLLINRI